MRVDHPEITSLAKLVIGAVEKFRSRFVSDGAAAWLQPRADLIDEEEFGSGFATGESLLTANFMNRLRKSGGADGTRTRGKPLVNQ